MRKTDSLIPVVSTSFVRTAMALGFAGVSLALAGSSAAAQSDPCIWENRCVIIGAGPPRELTPEEKAAALEAARKKREFDAKVAAETARLGAHREAEVRKRLQMKAAAEAARPKSKMPPAKPLKPCPPGANCVRPI